MGNLYAYFYFFETDKEFIEFFTDKFPKITKSTAEKKNRQFRGSFDSYLGCLLDTQKNDGFVMDKIIVPLEPFKKDIEIGKVTEINEKYGLCLNSYMLRLLRKKLGVQFDIKKWSKERRKRGKYEKSGLASNSISHFTYAKCDESKKNPAKKKGKKHHPCMIPKDEMPSCKGQGCRDGLKDKCSAFSAYKEAHPFMLDKSEYNFTQRFTWKP